MHQSDQQLRFQPSRRHALVSWAVIVSLLVHSLLVVLFVWWTQSYASINPRNKALHVWLTPPQKKIIPDINTAQKTLVTLDKASPRPKKARFIAEHDQSTHDERRAHAQQQSAVLSQPASAKQPRGSADARHKIAVRGVTQSRNKHDPLGLKLQFDDDKIQVSQSSHAYDDVLPDVKEGNKTALNAWQWRHAPYFNRIKSRIGEVWSPREQIARNDPNGILIGHKDRVTVLDVTINRQGYLTNIDVTSSSGVAYLDAEAERSFRKASPFLYPPSELFAGKEEFSFSFAFHLYLDRGFSFNLSW